MQVAKQATKLSHTGMRPVPALHRAPAVSKCAIPQSRRRTLNVSCQAASPSPKWYDNHRSLPSYRSVYDFTAWVNHRNPLRYFNRLFDVHESQVLRNTLPAVMWVTSVAVAIGLYTTAFAQGLLPAWAPVLSPNPFAQAFVTTTTVAMSLLLVFRTTQSYNRWDEARKFWGATLNRSRDIIRQAVTLFPEQKAKEALARWHVAFVRAMHRHFQNEGSLEADLKDVLTPAELQMLLKSQHRPMKALHVVGEIIMSQPMPPIHQMQMSLNVQHYHDQLGACERLLRTPIPVSYTRHTSRFLFMWLTILPFALWGTCGWATVPLTTLIAISLLKIDEIGMQIEEPFSILPLDVIAGRIHTDVMSTLKDDQEVKATVDVAVGRTNSVAAQPELALAN